MADPLLAVRDLRVGFPAGRSTLRAVDGVSFEVAGGEAVGIVGESGSGKSMTALALLRLVPRPGTISGGGMLLAGRDLLALDEPAMRDVRRSEMAMIFQDAGSYLNPIMTIGDQIAEAVGQRGSRARAVTDRVVEALRSVRIADPVRVAASYPYELSGGMQQRAMIASVLIRQPRLIIADEPTTALDATVQHQILRVLAALRAETKAALILISHDLAVVSAVCDRVHVMYGGQIVEEGATRDIFAAPKHPYTQALIEAILDPFDPKPNVTPLEGAPPDMADPPAGCRFHPRCRHAFAPCATRAPPRIVFGNAQAARCWLHADADATA